MPTSTPRKAPARKPAARKPRAANTLQAEAKPGEFETHFTWRGQQFVVDVSAISYGRATYASRIAANDSLPLVTRVNAMLDCFEAAIGQEQTAKAYEVAPDLFDNPVTMTEFWQATQAAVVGGTPGESKAS